MNPPEKPDVPDQLQEKLNELAILQESLIETKQKADSYHDQLVRLTADFHNFRKRSERGLELARAEGKQEAMESFLAFADALERAQSSLTPQTTLERITEGLKLLQGEMERVLRSLGAEPIKTEDCQFDPHLHEAVDRVESVKPEGAIVEELQRGYVMNGRVLRHARVRVAG